jgi:isocitrate lyase
MEEAIVRSVANYDMGADLHWCEFGTSDLGPLKEYSKGLRAVRPKARIAYNYSSSFGDHHETQSTMQQLHELGVDYAFITLYGIHAATLALYDWFKELKEIGEKAQWELELAKKGHPTESHHVMGDTAFYQDLEMKYLPTIARKNIEASDGYKKEAVAV